MFLNKELKPDFFTFTNGVVSIANKEGKFGLIDSTLTIVTNDWYEKIYLKDGQPVGVDKDKKTAWLNKNYGVMGNWYDGSNWFFEGLSYVYNLKINNETEVKLFGYVNIDGQEVIPCIYESAEDFSNGKASVTKDGVSFCIDKTGKTVECD